MIKFILIIFSFNNKSSHKNISFLIYYIYYIINLLFFKFLFLNFYYKNTAELPIETLSSCKTSIVDLSAEFKPLTVAINLLVGMTGTAPAAWLPQTTRSTIWATSRYYTAFYTAAAPVSYSLINFKRIS